jgi:glycosyl transferase family 25
MKTFVISLKRSVERRQFMIEQMNRLGLDYEIFDAIDCKEVTENDISRYRSDSPYWQTASIGIVCATLSHYLVFKKIVEQGLEYALVLEDDALLPKNIKNILAELEKVIKKDEIILLYYAGFKVLKLSLVGVETIKSGKLLFPVNIEDVGSAAAYIVHKNVAMNLIRINMPFKGMTDSWGIFYNNGGFDSCRCLYPPQIKPKNFKSSIDYIDPKSMIGKIVNMVNKHKIPVLFQLLALRRALFQKSLRRYKLVNEPSPIYTRLTSGKSTH